MKDEYKSQISLSIRVSAESYTMTTASSHSLLDIVFNKLFHLKQFLLMQYIQQVKETCEIGTTLNVNWDVWDKISFFFLLDWSRKMIVSIIVLRQDFAVQFSLYHRATVWQIAQ